MSALPETVELFSGEATTAEARVYARIKSDDPAERNSGTIRISGQLIGPVCEFSQTLPARHQFIEIQSTDRQPAELAQAIVPDPCFWTPDLPFLYRAELQLHRDGEIVAVNRTVGIRRLGIRGKSLFFDGKRFVLRGWHAGRMQNAECKLFLEHHQEFLRETWTALVVANPDDEVCEFASRRGILLVADLTEEGDVPIDSLRRVVRWPSVVVAILADGAIISVSQIAAIPNLLIAQFVSVDQKRANPPWADLLYIQISQPKRFAGKIAGIEVPVIAVRRHANLTNIEQARAECDILQRDLAPFGDFAGYLV